MPFTATCTLVSDITLQALLSHCERRRSGATGTTHIEEKLSLGGAAAEEDGGYGLVGSPRVVPPGGQGAPGWLAAYYGGTSAGTPADAVTHRKPKGTEVDNAAPVGSAAGGAMPGALPLWSAPSPVIKWHSAVPCLHHFGCGHLSGSSA